jgi:hypothetical protein
MFEVMGKRVGDGGQGGNSQIGLGGRFDARNKLAGFSYLGKGTKMVANDLKELARRKSKI